MEDHETQPISQEDIDYLNSIGLGFDD